MKQLYDARNSLPISPEQKADGRRRSQRIEEQRRASANIFNMALMAEIMAKTKEPASLEEALVDPSWKAAMQYSIIKNDTWELVDRPAKRKVIGTKWVWKVKHTADGTLEKFKARPVEHDIHRWKVLIFKTPLHQLQE